MTDKKYESLKIENIVASGVIAESIDLVMLSEKVKNCELNKKRFPGAVYRIEKPKIAALIFSTGKIVLTGIRDDKALKDGLAIVMKSVKGAGIETLKVPKVAITNMVCSYNLGTNPNNSPDLCTGSKIPRSLFSSSLQERSFSLVEKTLKTSKEDLTFSNINLKAPCKKIFFLTFF
jgi:hypothetical protein